MSKKTFSERIKEANTTEQIAGLLVTVDKIAAYRGNEDRTDTLDGVEITPRVKKSALAELELNKALLARKIDTVVNDIMVNNNNMTKEQAVESLYKTIFRHFPLEKMGMDSKDTLLAGTNYDKVAGKITPSINARSELQVRVKIPENPLGAAILDTKLRDNGIKFKKAGNEYILDKDRLPEIGRTFDIDPKTPSGTKKLFESQFKEANLARQGIPVHSKS